MPTYLHYTYQVLRAPHPLIDGFVAKRVNIFALPSFCKGISLFFLFGGIHQRKEQICGAGGMLHQSGSVCRFIIRTICITNSLLKVRLTSARTFVEMDGELKIDHVLVMFFGL